MGDPLRDQALDAIIAETVASLPEDALKFYRNPPGRKPLPQFLAVSEVAEKLSDDEALLLIRTVVDATVFSVLNLIDANFKDGNIAVRFERRESQYEEAGLLHELYRQRVEPGGEAYRPQPHSGRNE